MVLAMGASVGGKTKAGMPVFVEACKSAVEYQAMCLMLLEEGVNPNLVEEVTLLYLQVFLFKGFRTFIGTVLSINSINRNKCFFTKLKNIKWCFFCFLM